MAETDWNPELYGRFAGLRLRPALDLLSRVSDLPEGPVIDMGCGSGAVGGALATRFPDRDLIGLDQSPAMLEEAEETGNYTRLIQSDATSFEPDVTPALVFANALCHWLPDHPALFARWAGWLPSGGSLAVQMPRQYDAPSHALLRQIAEDIFPDYFDFSDWEPPVAAPGAYARLFSPDRYHCTVWETRYYQSLTPGADGSHPVRRFTQSTAMRPFLDKLDGDEVTRFIATYDARLQDAYGTATPDAPVLFPFQRLFFTVRRQDVIA